MYASELYHCRFHPTRVGSYIVATVSNDCFFSTSDGKTVHEYNSNGQSRPASTAAQV